jgi:hypothetical protein
METAATIKKTNPFRMRVAEWRNQEGLENDEAFQESLQGYVIDSVCPALCKEGCEVEPDGKCQHGCLSILLAMGLI